MVVSKLGAFAKRVSKKRKQSRLRLSRVASSSGGPGNITKANLARNIARFGTGQYCFFREQVNSTLPTISGVNSGFGPTFYGTCINVPISWIQTYDSTTSATDTQLPTVTETWREFHMIIGSLNLNVPTIIHVWMVKMTPAGQSYFGANAFSGGLFNINETHTGAFGNVSLNPEFFYVLHGKRFTLGKETAGSIGFPQDTNTIVERQRLYTHKCNPKVTYKDPIRGWTNLTENEVPRQNRTYILVAATSLYNTESAVNAVNVTWQCIHKVVH